MRRTEFLQYRKIVELRGGNPLRVHSQRSPAKEAVPALLGVDPKARREVRGAPRGDDLGQWL